MPDDDPRWMGGIGMIGTKTAYYAVMHCDLLLMVGTDYPYSNFLPGRGAGIRIDERAVALGRRAPTAFGAAGSVRPTLKLLLGQVAPKSDTSFWERVTKAPRVGCDARQASRSGAQQGSHPSAGCGPRVSDLAKPDAVFTLDAGLNTLWSGNWIHQSGSQRIIGSFNNAAVETALGQASGVQVLDRRSALLTV